MAADVRELFRLYRLYGRMNLNWFLQDVPICLIVLASELIAGVASFLGVLLLAVRFGGVGALRADEVLFMLGFFQLADGLSHLCFGGANVLAMSRRVGRGQLDHMMIQPRPLWMQLLTEAFQPVSGAGGFLVGIALTAVACARLRMSISPAWFLALLLYLACHTGIKLGQSFLYAAAAFYKPAACEELSSRVLDMTNMIGKYPLAGLPAWATAALMTVFPAGLMAYFPALALLGKLQRGAQYALPVAVAAAFMALATYFFRKGLHYYTKYGTNRYNEYGHHS